MQPKMGGHVLVFEHRGLEVLKSGHRGRLRQVGDRSGSSELEGGEGAESTCGKMMAKLARDASRRT